MQENCALNQMEKKMVYQRFEELTTIRFNTSVLLLLMIINLHLENLDVFVCHLYAFARMNVRCIKGEKKKLLTERISKDGCAKPIYVSETVILVVFFLFVIFIPFRSS